MPLIPVQYSDTVKSAYKKRNSVRIVTAMKKARAFSQFVDSGMTALGGIPATSVGIAQLANQYVSIWKKNHLATLGSKKESKAEHTLLKSAITTGGKHGIGGWMSGDYNAYANQLGDLWGKRLPLALMVVKEGKLKDTFVKSQIYKGSGTPPDFVNDISGLT